MVVNFYSLLEIAPTASSEEINKAYKKKAMVYHPDKNNGSEAADAMFKMIGLAKETLLDTQKRLEHDYSVGIKERPMPPPDLKYIVKKEVDGGAVLGWGLFAFLLGIAIAGGGKK